MGLKFRISHLYFILTFILVSLMVVPPISALLGFDFIAELFYNINEPLCHQYLGRSYCIFNNWEFRDCEPPGNVSANVETKFNYYISSKKYNEVGLRFDGEYEYNRRLVGLHRAEKIEYENGIYGYKLGVCARDFAIYFGLAISPLFYFILRRKVKYTPHILVAFLFLIPMAIDGTGQLFNLWESTNFIRFITGLISGVGIGYFLFSVLKDVEREKEK